LSIEQFFDFAGSPPWQREDTAGLQHCKQQCMMGALEAEARESHRQGLLGGAVEVVWGQSVLDRS
jgi:hypothetical protein